MPPGRAQELGFFKERGSWALAGTSMHTAVRHTRISCDGQSLWRWSVLPADLAMYVMLTLPSVCIRDQSTVNVALIVDTLSKLNTHCMCWPEQYSQSSRPQLQCLSKQKVRSKEATCARPRVSKRVSRSGSARQRSGAKRRPHGGPSQSDLE